jgi:hypothetical protein
MITPTQDRARVSENLAFIAANPSARYPAGWVAETRAEAIELGLLPAPAPRIGCNCRPGIDRGIIYGGDMEDIF